MGLSLTEGVRSSHNLTNKVWILPDSDTYVLYEITHLMFLIFMFICQTHLKVFNLKFVLGL